jgi:hypothetical protein
MRYGARAGGVPWNTLRPVRIVANRTCGASSVLLGKMREPCECGKRGFVFQYCCWTESAARVGFGGELGERQGGERAGTDQLMSTSGYETRPSLCVCAYRNPKSSQDQNQSTSFAKATCIASRSDPRTFRKLTNA